MKKLIIIISLVLTLSGCSDMSDMYNLIFPAAMAVDYQNEEYEVKFQMLNPNSLSKPELESSINKGEILIISQKGKTISEAIQRLEDKLRMQMVLTDVNTVFLSKNMLNSQALEGLIDYFLVDPELRLTASVFINEGEIDDIFTVKHNITSSPYFSLMAYNSQTKMTSLNIPDSMLSIMRNYYSDQEVSIIPNMDIDEESKLLSEGELSEKAQYEVKNITLLNLNQFTTFSIDDVRGLQYITSKENKNVMETFDYQGTSINFQLESAKKKIYYQDGIFHIQIDPVISIGPTTLELSMDEILTATKDYIQKTVKDTYHLLLDNDIDFLRLQNLNSTPLTKENIEIDIEVILETKSNYLK